MAGCCEQYCGLAVLHGVSRFVGWLAGYWVSPRLVSRLVGWLVTGLVLDWLVAWLVGYWVSPRLVSRLVGWLLG